MSIDLQFDEDRRESIEQAWIEWWAGELGRPIVSICNPARFSYTSEELNRQFLLDAPVEEMLDHFQLRLESTSYHGDALPAFRPWFGPNGATGFLGGRLEPAPEHNTVWGEVDQPTPLRDLDFHYDPGNFWWQRAVGLTEGAVDRWGDKVSIDHPTHSGIIDILATFRRTHQLLYDLYDSPDEIVRLCSDITDAWVRYYQELHGIIKKANRGTVNSAGMWSPKSTYMHQCDFSCMISAEMFEKFVMPDLDRCVRQMSHAFYHLDGEGAIPHLDLLLSLDALGGIQWVPEAGKPRASEWLPLLKRVRDGGKLCQVFVDPEGARRVVRELGGRGFCFIVTPSNPMPPKDIDDFLAVLASEDKDGT